MEVRPQRVVDELRLLLVRLGPGAVLEDDVVVPAALDPKVGLLRRAGVAVLHEGVAGEDVLHPDLLLVRAALVLLEEFNRTMMREESRHLRKLRKPAAW